MSGEDTKRNGLIKSAVERSAWDPAYFCRFFLPHWFPSEMPPFHLGLLALMTRKVEFLNEYPRAHDFLLRHFVYQADPRDPISTVLPVFQLNEQGKIIMVAGEHNNVIVPRGFSKTTLENAVNLYESVTDGKVFIVYISKSSEHAETQLGNIRIELETNALLREAYGNVVPTRADVEKWQSDQLQLRNGAIIIARGRGGQVRGLNYQARRPNRITLDDVEDDDTVASPTIRKSTENWFYTSVEKAGAEMESGIGEDWAQDPLRITNLGTLLSSDCLMMTLAKDPDFSTIKFGSKLDLMNAEDTEMLWAAKMSYATYNQKRARHAQIGKLAEFTREIDSSIRVTDDAIFPSVFIYEYTTRADLIHVSQVLDPAISDKPDADHATIVVAGRREKDGAIWALDEWGGTGKTPREKIDNFFLMHEKWRTTHNGIEANAYQKSLIFLMREEMAERRYFFPITPITQGRNIDKMRRIEGMLSPRYQNGIIRHLRPLVGLEGNILDWPNGKKDYPDAFAMALTLLGETQMLVIPEEERNAGEYAPLPETLPPIHHAVSNYIMNSIPDPHQGRYG